MSNKETAQRIELSEVKSNMQDYVELTQRDYKLVKNVLVDVDVELGCTSITVEKLFSLKAGEVISLDKEVDQTIDLIVDGKKIASGNLVAIDGVFGVEIVSVE